MSWPLALWGAHLLVPAAGLGYVILTARLGGALGRANTLLLLVSVVWLLVGLGILLAPAGRDLLRRRRREVGLLLATSLVGAIVLDAGLTLSGVVPTYETLASRYTLRYRPATLVQGRLQPSQVLELPDRPRIEINRHGFRGPEIPVPKSPGTTRVLFLGGSQVFDQNGENWPIEVGRLLTRSGYPVDVVNAGVPAHRTLDSVGKLLSGLWMLEPDVVVLCQAWNDLKYFTRLHPDRSYEDLFSPSPHEWGFAPTGAERLLGVSSVYRLLRTRLVDRQVGAEGERWRASAGSSVTVWGPRQYRIGVEAVCDLARNLDARMVLCTQPRLPVSDSPPEVRARIGYEYVGLDHAGLVAAFEICDRVVTEVAAARGLPLLDLDQALSGRPELFDDHIHFNRDGGPAAARIVADGLRPIIADSAARRDAS